MNISSGDLPYKEGFSREAGGLTSPVAWLLGHMVGTLIQPPVRSQVLPSFAQLTSFRRPLEARNQWRDSAKSRNKRSLKSQEGAKLTTQVPRSSIQHSKDKRRL